MTNRRLFLSCAPTLALVAMFGCSAVLGIPSEIGREADDAGGGANNEGSVVADAPAGDEHAMPDAGSDADATILPDTAPPPLCDLRKGFDPPVLLMSVSTPGLEGSPKLSEDELTIYFDAQRGAEPYFDLYTATRSSLTDTFGPATLVPGGVNTTTSHEFAPNVSPDGLNMFFERKDPASTVDNFYIATRPTAVADWGTAVPISGVNLPEYQGKLDVHGDGSDLYFTKKGTGTKYHLYNARRGAGGGYVTMPLTALNGPGGAEEYGSAVSADGLTLYFASTRAGGAGGEDVWVATRNKRTDDFSAVNVSLEATINSPQDDEPSWLSTDGCRLYMQSTRTGVQDIYVAIKPK